MSVKKMGTIQHRLQADCLEMKATFKVESHGYKPSGFPLCLNKSLVSIFPFREDPIFKVFFLYNKNQLISIN